MLLTSGDGFTKKTPRAMGFHCCSHNMAAVLPPFGGCRRGCCGMQQFLCLMGISDDIPAERHILGNRAHGVLRVQLSLE